MTEHDNPWDEAAYKARREKMEKVGKAMGWYSAAIIGFCFVAAPIMLIALAVGGGI